MSCMRLDDSIGLTMARKKAPELNFQKHIADFLVREHKYGVLEQGEITDTEHFIAEDLLWAFLNDTQPDTIKKLADDYGTDARDEVFRALRSELQHTPLWLLIRHGLKVRGSRVSALLPEAAIQRERGGQALRQKPHHLPAALLLW